MQRAAIQTMSPEILSPGVLQLSCADQDHLPVPQQLHLRAAETPSAHRHFHFDFFSFVSKTEFFFLTIVPHYVIRII